MPEYFSEEHAHDLWISLVGGGFPSAFNLAYALYRGDIESAKYYVTVSASVLGAQYAILQFLNMVQGPRYAMTFMEFLRGVSTLRTVTAFSVPVLSAGVLAVAADTNNTIWKRIGDQKTGSVYWSQAGDVSSGGSMPVVSDLPTWDDVVQWWDRL